MDLGKLHRGERMAAISGIALLLIMLAFSWFAVDIPAEARAFAEMAGQDFSFNAFEAFEVIDLVLLVTIIVAVGLAWAGAAGKSVRLPVSPSALTAGLGILSTFLIFYRILDPPGAATVDIARRIGVFLGLLAAAGIAYGGWISMKATGVTFAAEADRIQDRFETRETGGPPPETGGPSPESGGPPPATG